MGGGGGGGLKTFFDPLMQLSAVKVAGDNEFKRCFCLFSNVGVNTCIVKD